MLTLMQTTILPATVRRQEQEAQLTVFKPNGQFGFTGMFHRRKSKQIIYYQNIKMLLINHTDYLQLFNIRFRVKSKTVSSQTRSVLVRLHVEKHRKEEKGEVEGVCEEGEGEEGGEVVTVRLWRHVQCHCCVTSTGHCLTVY